jgi:hypothetical protein
LSDPNSLATRAQFRSQFGLLVLDPRLALGRVLSTDWIAEVVAAEVGKTADRIFSPLATLAQFLGQVLSDDHSCRGAVARLLAWRAARGLPGCSPDDGGYCKARRRLPDSLLPRLVRESADRLAAHGSKDWQYHGRRVVIADGTTASMPDTPANQAAFPQHSKQEAGCGFPIARILVLLSLATGCVLDAAIGGSKGKLTGEHALLRSLRGRLEPGDIPAGRQADPGGVPLGACRGDGRGGLRDRGSDPAGDREPPSRGPARPRRAARHQAPAQGLPADAGAA